MKVRVKQDRFGCIHLTPTTLSAKKEIAASNKYDGSYEVYLQIDHEIEIFLSHLNAEQRESIENGWIEVIDFDQWTYRQMVGGQSN